MGESMDNGNRYNKSKKSKEKNIFKTGASPINEKMDAEELSIIRQELKDREEVISHLTQEMKEVNSPSYSYQEEYQSLRTKLTKKTLNSMS